MDLKKVTTTESDTASGGEVTAAPKVRSVGDRPLEVAIAAVWLATAAALVLFALLHDPAPVAHPVGSGETSGVPERQRPDATPTGGAPTGATPTGDPPTTTATAEPSLGDLLPPSSCVTDAAATMTCTDPAPGVASVVIRTYPSRLDIYAAYIRDVEAVSGETFHGNVGDCSGSQDEGELTWATNRTKSRDFPLRELRDDLVVPASAAAGRVFCTTSGDETTIIWTEHPFRVATVVGDSAELVGKWWVDAHIALACVDAAGCPVTG